MKLWSIVTALVVSVAASVSGPALAQFQVGPPIVLFGQQPDGSNASGQMLYRHRHHHHGHIRHAR